MHSNSQRLHKHSFLKTHFCWQLVNERLGKFVVSTQTTMGSGARTRGCRKSHIRAKVVATRFAGLATGARKAGFDADVVVDGEGCHGGSDAVDCSRSFVAHCQGVGRRDLETDSTMMPEMDLEWSLACSVFKVLRFGS